MFQDHESTTGPRTGGGETTIRRFATRRRILAAAKPRIARAGTEQVSLQDVALGAHMSLGDLLQHYRDRRSLVMAVLDEGWKDLLPRLKDIESNSISAHSAILGVFALMTGTLQKDQDLLRLFLLEGRRPDHQSGEMGFSDGYRRFMQICRDLVARGQRDGSFRAAYHPHVAASLLVGALEGMLRDRLVAEQERRITPYGGTDLMRALDALITSLKN